MTDMLIKRPKPNYSDKKDQSFKRTFEVDGKRMKFKGEPNKSAPEMTIMIGPATATSSVYHASFSAAKQMAEAIGISTKHNKQYLLVAVKRKFDHFNHLTLKIKRLTSNKIVVSDLTADSYAAGRLKIGDRILAINGQKIDDKIQCREIILNCNGDFEALVERQRNSPKVDTVKPLRSVDSFVCTQFIPLQSTYKALSRENSLQKLCTPLECYQTKLPKDVRNFPHNFQASSVLQNNSLTFDDNSKSTVIINDSGKRVTIDSNVLLEIIPSDIDPKRVLRVPSRNSCWLE